MEKVFLTLVVILNIIFASLAFSQADTFYVASDMPPSEGNLNRAIDSIIQKRTLSSTLFMLETNGYYVITDSILIPSGETLTIIASEPGITQHSAPPQLLWSSRNNNDKKHFFISYGNLTKKCMDIKYRYRRKYDCFGYNIQT